MSVENYENWRNLVAYPAIDRERFNETTKTHIKRKVFMQFEDLEV